MRNTLESVFQTQDRTTDTPNTTTTQRPVVSCETSGLFNTYLNVFSHQINYRFPNVSDLEVIDQDAVRNIAKFSVAVTPIALEVWETVAAKLPEWTGEGEEGREGRDRRESRAA